MFDICETSLETFVKLNSWPADFTAPVSPAYLEIGGKKFENIPSKAFKDVTWIEDLPFDSSTHSMEHKAFPGCNSLKKFDIQIVIVEGKSPQLTKCS